MKSSPCNFAACSNCQPQMVVVSDETKERIGCGVHREFVYRWGCLHDSGLAHIMYSSPQINEVIDYIFNDESLARCWSCYVMDPVKERRARHYESCKKLTRCQ